MSNVYRRPSRIKSLIGRTLGVLSSLSLLPSLAPAAQPVPPASQEALLGHVFTPLLPGKPVALKQYAGQVILVVNTASQCGFTYQYQGLEKLHQSYKGKGLVVLGFPSNDFGNQEPAASKEIADFCEVNYGVTFQMLDKLATPIPRNPFYAGLIRASGQAPQWNFHKYLIDRQGRVKSFPSAVEPTSRQLTSAIDAALQAK
jgi:glutathione peroxidase